MLQIDIAPTVGELLGFQTPLAEGSVLAERRLSSVGRQPEVGQDPRGGAGLGSCGELSKRDLLATIADANLKREASQLAPSLGTEMLMPACSVRPRWPTSPSTARWSKPGLSSTWSKPAKTRVSFAFWLNWQPPASGEYLKHSQEVRPDTRREERSGG